MEDNKLLEYNYIFVPSDNNSDLTLILLHGTGGDEHDLIDIGKKIDPHANLISPRGNVLEGQYNRFFERFSDGVFNEADIKKRSMDLAHFIEAAKEKHDLKNTNIVAVGFSNGANMAASILLLYPQVLNGAILLRAMLPIKPSEKPNLNNKPILLLSGINDRMMAESKVKELAELFKAGGAKLTHEWQNTGHNLTSQDVEISTKWLSDNFKNL